MPLFRCEAELFTVEGKKGAESIAAFQNREMMGAMRAFLKACMPRIPTRTGFLRAAFKPFRDFFSRGEAGADLNPSLQALLYGEGNHPDLKRITPGTTAREVFDKLQNSDSRGKPLSETGKAARIRAYQREFRQKSLNHRKTKAGRAVKDARHTEWYYTSNKQRVAKTPANARKFVKPQDPGSAIRYNGDCVTLSFDIQIAYYRINDNYSRISGAPWRSMDAGFQAALNYLEKAARRYPYLTEVLVTQRIFLRGTKVGKEPGNQAADYRGRFGSKFLPTAGQQIDENSIAQSGDHGDQSLSNGHAYWHGSPS